MKKSIITGVALIAMAFGVFTGMISYEIGIGVGVLSFVVTSTIATFASTVILYREGRKYLASSFPNSQYFVIATSAIMLQFVSFAEMTDWNPRCLLIMAVKLSVIVAITTLSLPYFSPVEIPGGDPKKPAPTT